MSDDFTPEEIELFEKLDQDELKKIERFKKWADRKASETEKGKAASSNRDLTLSELRAMMSDAPTRSILKSLMAEAEALGANLNPANPKKSPGENPKRGRLI
jgi:hypothetical protein